MFVSAGPALLIDRQPMASQSIVQISPARAHTNGCDCQVPPLLLDGCVYSKKKRAENSPKKKQQITIIHLLSHGTHLGESYAGRGHLSEVVSFENCKR